MNKLLLATCLLISCTSFSPAANAIVDPTTQPPPSCTCAKADKADKAEKASCNKGETCDCSAGKPKCVKK